MGRRGLCSGAVGLLALLVPLSKLAVPRLVRLSQQPAVSQRRFEPTLDPPYRPNLVRGLSAPMMVTDERLDFLENSFTHRPGDIWVATYAKVGTTWTQYIVSQLLGYPAVTNELNLFGVSPWPEVAHGALATTEKALENWPQGRARVMKTHWLHEDYMAKVPNSSKIIFVYRDVESVAVSYFHHILDKFAGYWIEPEEMPWDVFFEKFMLGEFDFGRYFEHVASWWPMRDAPNVLFLRFEDLKRDPRATVRRIADFIGVELEDARLEEVVDATSFRSMKKWGDDFVSKFLKFTGTFRGDHIRGGPKERLLTESQRARLEERFDALLKPLGVPHEHFFPSP